MSALHEVLSIGNAIVDVLSHVEEDFIPNHGLEKGTMRLIDSDMAVALLEGLDQKILASGGSAANTAACIASLGAGSAYIGKVANDANGIAFGLEMDSLGVMFESGTPCETVPTATCIAVVTPDGERTMSTFLGACRELEGKDIPDELVASSKTLFLEGYLLDNPSTTLAVEKAARRAKEAGREVVLSLSDANCVRRNRIQFNKLLAESLVDVVIANEKEIAALLEAEHGAVTPHEAIEICRRFPFTSVVTLGPMGAAVVRGGTVERAAAYPVDAVVDLVGAGDAFAAGYLVGHSRGFKPLECLQLGAACAAEIITTNGARPHRPLLSLPRVQSILAGTGNP